MCVCVCSSAGLLVARVQQVMQQFLNETPHPLRLPPFVLRSTEYTTGGVTAHLFVRGAVRKIDGALSQVTVHFLRRLLFVCLQLLDLFLQWDWSTYLADYGKPTCKYLRVNPHTALTLLDK